MSELVDVVRSRGGALPTAGSPNRDEVRLARWLAKRRWESNAGILSPSRTSTLDALVPHWRQSTHSREGFEATLAECVAWRETHGWVPRSTGGDETETRLGAWLVARRYDARIDRLPADHEAMLDAQMPDWRSRPAAFTRVATRDLRSPSTQPLPGRWRSAERSATVATRRSA
ncbi:hypothetical protein JVX92_14950 (plasmid) [Microbacterium hominis]|uniref:helicase associated domain-containing protein n=1 Tax=Microbacterium hominis TaxID=162426 RepID=UPI001965AE06|nr:helicase associated domain-containing protein [Microbacterium hominis]QRY42333.1 hypothetical protein JVX92_14950 [Microbacterium hominis]